MSRDKNDVPHTYVREAEVTYRRRRVAGAWDTNVRTSADVIRLLRPIIGSRVAESLLVLALNGRQSVIGYHEVARGSTSDCPVVPCDVFRFPIGAGAQNIIIAHNHPSGSTSPSDEDIAITDRLCEAAALLGIRLLDHVIVTDTEGFSFLDEGMIRQRRVVR